jgi:hypothetical protein
MNGSDRIGRLLILSSRCHVIDAHFMRFTRTKTSDLHGLNKQTVWVEGRTPIRRITTIRHEKGETDHNDFI